MFQCDSVEVRVRICSRLTGLSVSAVSSGVTFVTAAPTGEVAAGQSCYFPAGEVASGQDRQQRLRLRVAVAGPRASQSQPDTEVGGLQATGEPSAGTYWPRQIYRSGVRFRRPTNHLSV